MKDENKNKIEDRKYCVYIHTSPSGKKYVGQTCLKPEYRWRNGTGYLYKKNEEYKQPAFARAILKYGWNNFQHEVISDNLTKEEADSLEKLLIEKLNAMNPEYGYNCTEGGSNGHLSEDTKAKISESLKGEKHPRYGKHLSESTKKKISDSHKGKTPSEETRKKLSEARKGEKNHMYGKHHTEESRKKISENNKGVHAGADHCRARKVVQYDLQESLIKIWDCMSDAARELGINCSNIYKCCNGKYKTAGGFVWRYCENIEVAV